MDGREYDVTEPGDRLLASRFKQAQAGNEDAQTFFCEALGCQNAVVQSFLGRQADQGHVMARLLLRGYYLSLLMGVRTGDKHAADILCEQILEQDHITHELLLELIACDDQVALTVLYTSYDCLLEQLWKGGTRVLAFFHEQLQRQNDAALMYLSERARQDTRVCTVLLYPYYQLLLSQAVGNERDMTVFRKQLQRKDEVIQAFLVQQVEKGSDDAFRVLWECYRSEVERYVQQLIVDANRRLVEELTQAIFAKVWRSLPNRSNKDQKMQFRAWLYKVVSSEVFDYFDYLKARRASASISLMEANLDTSIPGPEDGVCVRDCLKEALLSLNERARKCILMADVEGYSIQEIAKVFDIRPSTVRAYLSRGREDLRDYYLQALNHESGGAQQRSSDSKKRLSEKQETGEQDLNERGGNCG